MDIVLGVTSNIILLVTTIIAWVKYGKYNKTLLKYLPHYLSYAVILEIGGDFFINEDNPSTVWYNIGINIEILFYLVIFYLYLKNPKSKKLVIYAGIIYEIYFLVNVLILESWSNYQVFPFTLGGIFLIIIIFLFLLEMFKSDKILHTQKYLIFWVALGLLFYYIIPLPLFVIRSILPASELSFLMTIQYIANIIMYLSFIYGFLWSSMKYK
jgi:hypothetical protein